jgi:hypothetical protein
MLVMTDGGRERTRGEFAELLCDAHALLLINWVIAYLEDFQLLDAAGRFE